METTMFALGVLAMIMVMLITVVVVGIVKAFKMSKQIKEVYHSIHETERWLDQKTTDAIRQFDEKIDGVYRDIDMIEHAMSNGLDHELRGINDQITDSVTQSNSYTDKRIDKLIDTYFMVKEAEQTSKKLIKG